ncbi:MAG: hypothetical protein A2Y33_08995 [Spirochaetes bacterium GWF1_51_8]|nr:MAG: hypothetical protein A2Y33_08995 [Spirochaetes bacterium GWF1_51_8]
MDDYQIISFRTINDLISSAKRSPRLRRNLNLHEPEDVIQRFLNAMTPGTYVRPHRHMNPPTAETFIVLRGRVAVVFFDDFGNITGYQDLGEKCEGKGIDLKPEIWHSVICLKDAVLFEVKQGPYRPETAKEFAEWAPPEDDVKVKDYLRYVIEKIGG